ncbi:MAG: hypothetical protein ABH868_06535 [bacterium]
MIKLKELLNHTPRRARALWGLLFVSVAYLFFSACAGGNYEYYNSIHALMARNQYRQADAKVEENLDKIYGKKDMLLYYFDRALLLHLEGEWAESNKMLQKAEALADSYFTKSISSEASTFLISDNMRPYYGEDFERAMIHVFGALNYIYMGEFDEALVEARRVDLFLSRLKVDYGHKNFYTEDAFIRYLMGIIYESRGEINDAFISYRKALNRYKETQGAYGVKVPPELVQSALQAASDMGFRDEYFEIKNEFPKLSENFVPEKRKKTNGEIVLLHYNGRVPHKIDSIFKMEFGRAWGFVGMVDIAGEAQEEVNNVATVIETIASEEQVIIAFPKFVPSPYSIFISEVQVGDEIHRTELVQDIGAIAVKNMEDRKGRMFFKSVARAAIKFALAKGAERKIKEKTKSEVAQWILTKAVKTASALTEKADKRSWRTLPDQIRMSRVSLPGGTYPVEVTFVDKKGYEEGKVALGNVTVTPGKKTFLYLSTLR